MAVGLMKCDPVASSYSGAAQFMAKSSYAPQTDLTECHFDGMKHVMSIARTVMDRKIARGVSPSRFRGVPEHEIERLETYYSLRFPEPYRDYLLLMGYEPAGCGKSVDIRFGCLEAINREFFSAMDQVCGNVEAGAAFAIYADQGVDYLYFSVSDSTRLADPPLYRFRTVRGGAHVGCASISDYLERLLTGAIILDP